MSAAWRVGVAGSAAGAASSAAMLEAGGFSAIPLRAKGSPKPYHFVSKAAGTCGLASTPLAPSGARIESAACTRGEDVWGVPKQSG